MPNLTTWRAAVEGVATCDCPVSHPGWHHAGADNASLRKHLRRALALLRVAEEMEEGLQKYGSHLIHCSLMTEKMVVYKDRPMADWPPCSCGFDDVLVHWRTALTREEGT